MGKYLRLTTHEEVERLWSKECDDRIVPVGLIHNITGRILAALVLGFQELGQLFGVTARFLLCLFIEELTPIQGERFTKNPPSPVSWNKFAGSILHVWANLVAVTKRTTINARGSIASYTPKVWVDAVI